MNISNPYHADVANAIATQGWLGKEVWIDLLFDSYSNNTDHQDNTNGDSDEK
jgi:hypothetical protein